MSLFPELPKRSQHAEGTAAGGKVFHVSAATDTPRRSTESLMKKQR